MFDTAIVTPELFRQILNNKIGRLKFPLNTNFGNDVRLFEYLPELDKLTFNILYCNITRRDQTDNNVILDISVREAELQISDPPAYTNPNAIHGTNVTYSLVFGTDKYFH